MKYSEDGTNPFRTALRGLKEEIIGPDHEAVSPDNIKFFSLFREFDYWRNSVHREQFWNINVGLAGMLVLSCSIEEVFDHWLHAADRAEFRHIIGVPYNFENLQKIIESLVLDPGDFEGLRVPPGTDEHFRNLASRSLWRRQHPTNTIRLIRCLSADFPEDLREIVERYL
jgi:hypothetical protein